MITETDNKVLACLSKGQKKACQVGQECFSPAGELCQKTKNHYTIVAGGHLRRMEKKGLVRRVRIGLPPNERVEWKLAEPGSDELF